MSSEFVVDFPTLGDLADGWIEAHCRVPDGFTRGKPFKLADWQFWCTANRYRIRPEAEFVHPDDVGPDDPPVLNQAFRYRQTLIVAPQKTGKGPWSAAQVAFEACGPSVFGGWAEPGDVYRCEDNGCDCGWEFPYEVGEPKGMRHPSPLIQITATSEDQADNIYRPLRAMIKLGPLKNLLAVREGFIRVLGLSGDEDLDRIDVVTASANSRLGNPISDAEQDEVGLYTKSNKMINVAETQRRGAAGMGGRTHATTNAWDPAQKSYAQQVFESKADDIFVFYRNPDDVLRDEDGEKLDYRKPSHRRRIHEYVYEGSWWANLDSIEAEAIALLETDPAQAERFFGNRVVAGSDAWVDGAIWDLRAAPRDIELKTQIVLGFDGSKWDDWTGIRAETQDGYQFTPVTDVGPTVWNPLEHDGEVPVAEVNAAVEWLFKHFDVVRMYCDPPYWETQVDEWASKYGEKRVIAFYTNSPRRMTSAAERLRVDVLKADSGFAHDGCEHTRAHIYNARKVQRTGSSVYKIAKPGQQDRKIDLSICSVLAHEAAGDATAANLWRSRVRRQSKLIVV